MPTLDLQDPKGAKRGTVELDDGVFGIEPNVPVMHQVVTAQLAARRAAASWATTTWCITGTLGFTPKVAWSSSMERTTVPSMERRETEAMVSAPRQRSRGRIGE